MFFILSQVWDKEKILSPHEESNLTPSDFMLRCSTTEPQRQKNQFVASLNPLTPRKA